MKLLALELIFSLLVEGLFGKGRDPDIEGKRYRDAGWNAYLKRLANYKCEGEIFTLLDLYICIINK